MKSKKVNILHIILASICFLPMQIYACSCDAPDIRDQIENSDIIFLGRLDEIIKKNDFAQYAHLSVIDIWKGPSEKKIIMLQGGGLDCISYFDQIEIGLYFLIFALESNENREKIYWASACGDVERIESEKNRIQYLNDIFD